MYSVGAYGRMLSDRVRIGAYTEALGRAVTPGCTVVDIGTGTGFFAMFACQLGAGKVYAIEPDDVIRFAREHARANGFAERIEFIQQLSTNVSLPRPADVVVSDLRTVLPWYQHHIPTIIDARERLLAPGGTLIPGEDRVWAAAVELPEFHSDHVGHQPETTGGFDMSAARRAGANAWAKARAKPEQLLTEPAHVATLDYRSLPHSNVDAKLDWNVTRSGVMHGIVAWFDTVLVGDIGFSNSPSAEPALYGNAFFPLADPVAVEMGETISVSLRADLIEDDYIWRWGGRVTTVSGDVKAHFSQHNISKLPPLASLRRREPDHVPVLDEKGQVDLFILSRMTGSASLRDIARDVCAEFPIRFSTAEQALEAVSELSFRHSRPT